MNNGRIKIILILITAIFATIAALFVIHRRYKTVIVDIPKFYQSSSNVSTPAPNANGYSSPDSKFIIPDSLFLPVPFTPQAPTANWDELHNEACEEADAIMAAEYFLGNKDTQLDPLLVEDQISKLTKWQEDNFGYFLDTTSAETARMIEQVYGLKTELKDNFTEEDIQKALSENKLVLISTFGRALGNPYYKRPGPMHHMLLIKGYNSIGIITNDSGTKRGLNYTYDFDTIYKAAGDWNHEDATVDTGKKIAIVVWDAKHP